MFGNDAQTTLDTMQDMNIVKFDQVAMSALRSSDWHFRPQACNIG